MVALVLGGVAVALWLLWRMLRVQETRANIEATRLIADSFHRRQGTLEEARAAGRVTEFILDAYATFDGGAPSWRWDEVQRWAKQQPEIARDLEREARTRGVPCELLENWWHVPTWREPAYPGTEPPPGMTCAELCGDSLRLPILPPGVRSVPLLRRAPCALH